MPSLSHSPTNDAGVATIFVILAMTATLVGAALAIDVGSYFATARSAQSSADGTVLALASDCALNEPIGDYRDYHKDGQTIDNPTCGTDLDDDCDDYAAVTVTGDVSGLLLPQVNEPKVSRSATACWGILSGAITAPVVISQCAYELATADGTTFPSAELDIPFGSGGVECGDRPPGAFGWLDTTDSVGPCQIETTLDDNGQLIVADNPGTGTNNPWECITGVGVGGTLTLPVYAASCFSQDPCVAGQNDSAGTNNWYLILGFAEIEITGWNLRHGSPRTAGTVPTCSGPGSAGSCVRGRFVRFSRQLGSTGPATDFGVQLIYLYE